MLFSNLLYGLVALGYDEMTEEYLRGSVWWNLDFIVFSLVRILEWVMVEVEKRGWDQLSERDMVQ